MAFYFRNGWLFSPEYATQRIARYEERINQVVEPFFEHLRRLTTIPGISETAAKAIIAEIGCNMSQFPSHRHLASWAGVCSGNNQSAGKRKSGATTNGNHWLRATLGEVAWVAGRTKHTYLASRYRRLASRRGKKRAIVAVAHQMLTIAYFIIRDHTTYHELGEDFYDRQRSAHLVRYHAKRLQRLGFEVDLKPAQAA